MKKQIISALCFSLVFAACTKEKSQVTPTAPAQASQTTPAKTGAHLHTSQRFAGDTSDLSTGSQFITIATANTMINSYLTSINSSSNDTDLRSLTVNADSLRAYLAANTSIRNIKLVFAHTMDYINAGYGGTYSGYQAGALTILIAGYDGSGNYVYYNSGYVLDHAIPCPYTCPNGAASSYTFTN